MLKNILQKSSLINKKKLPLKKNSPHLFLLFCIILGTILRFTLLTSKPLWTDEIATLVFSLGNDYNSIPLNELITINQILKPLELNYHSTIKDIAYLLINEDNHPPLYFILANLWYRLFSNHTNYISLWVARSLPAILGILSIPATYYLAKISFNSQKITFLATWLMTVSPYGIYLAQEARHYSLSILWVIASLSCLMISIKFVLNKRVIPTGLIIFWIVINSLGFLTHYFFLITLMAEGVCLCFFHAETQRRREFKEKFLLGLKGFNLRRFLVVGVAIVITFLGWFILIIPNDYGNGMTSWIQNNDSSFLSFVSPIFQLFATLITMISLLPVESNFLPLVIISGVVMLVFFVWLLPRIFKGILSPKSHYQTIIIKMLVSFFLASITIFFLITYFLKMDITRGARYSFVYFPIVILIVAFGLSHYKINLSKKSLLILAFMGLFSAITIIFNLGYQKYYRPDLLVPIINNNYLHSSHNIAIATTHKTLVETGEMMSVAWELKEQKNHPFIKFLLVHQIQQNDPNSTIILQEEINKIDSPLDLWLVNFYAPITLDNCLFDKQTFPPIDGYNYQLYHCS